MFGIGVAKAEQEGSGGKTEDIVTIDQPTFGLAREQLAGGERKERDTDKLAGHSEIERAVEEEKGEKTE